MSALAGVRRYVVCVGGVEVFDSPARDERLASCAARLRHGARVLVVAQERDWLKVRYAMGKQGVIFTGGVYAVAFGDILAL